MTSEDTRTLWEQRASESGTGLSGVLFRGLSETANAAIHAWHEWLVGDLFASKVAAGGRVLDLGCGYGRLSKTLQARRPDVTIMGQDIAFNYCKLFQATTGQCVFANASALPYLQGSFDAVLAVTCLMYAPRTGIIHYLRELHDVLRPGGGVLMVDPGVELQRLIGHLRGTRNRSPTGGQGFARREYLQLVAQAGFQLLHEGGNPNLSAALLIPGIGHSASGMILRTLKYCARRDSRVGGYSRFALHRWILAKRPGRQT